MRALIICIFISMAVKIQSVPIPETDQPPNILGLPTLTDIIAAVNKVTISKFSRDHSNVDNFWFSA